MFDVYKSCQNNNQVIMLLHQGFGFEFGFGRHIGRAHAPFFPAITPMVHLAKPFDYFLPQRRPRHFGDPKTYPSQPLFAHPPSNDPSYASVTRSRHHRKPIVTNPFPSVRMRVRGPRIGWPSTTLFVTLGRLPASWSLRPTLERLILGVGA